MTPPHRPYATAMVTQGRFNVSFDFHKVPVGTVAMSGGLVIADLTQTGQTFIAAKGGHGGLGNLHFVTATDQAPEHCTKGTPGEEKVLTMELKTIADIGLVRHFFLSFFLYSL